MAKLDDILAGLLDRKQLSMIKVKIRNSQNIQYTYKKHIHHLKTAKKLKTSIIYYINQYNVSTFHKVKRLLVVYNIIDQI